jgi:hypothetical protein
MDDEPWDDREEFKVRHVLFRICRGSIPLLIV